MEIKWLEDFISVAETRSFSRSAELRHVTQPAFSRRIQALEAWLGSQLIDRSAYPTRLTQAGLVFQPQALAMLEQAREARTLLRGQGGAAPATIEFAVPHTLSLTYFPRWLSRIEAGTGGRLHARLRAMNVHDAVLSLMDGGCDLVMVYHHPSHPVVLDPARYDMLVLGTEGLSPYSAPARSKTARSHRPRYTLAGSAGGPTPYLSYTPDAYLGQMTEVIFANVSPRPWVEKVYETDMAEGLKEMALAGHGLAFLPHSAVEDVVGSGTLLRLDADSRGAREGRASLVMEIRLYRDRLAAEKADTRQSVVSALWEAAARDARGADPGKPPDLFQAPSRGGVRKGDAKKT